MWHSWILLCQGLWCGNGKATRSPLPLRHKICWEGALLPPPNFPLPGVEYHPQFLICQESPLFRFTGTEGGLLCAICIALQKALTFMMFMKFIASWQRNSLLSSPAAIPGRVAGCNKEATHSRGIKGIFDELASCPFL